MMKKPQIVWVLMAYDDANGPGVHGVYEDRADAEREKAEMLANPEFPNEHYQIFRSIVVQKGS
jgi:hypothetical protein